MSELLSQKMIPSLDQITVDSFRGKISDQIRYPLHNTKHNLVSNKKEHVVWTTTGKYQYILIIPVFTIPAPEEFEPIITNSYIHAN